MDAARKRKLIQAGADAYLALVALVLVVYGLLLHRWSPSWILSDWLINYEGGFVRRGLAGEVFFRMGRLLHIAPRQLVTPVVMGFYAVLLPAFRAILRRSTYGLWVLFVLFSPAILAFPVLQSEAGYHKEVFFLAALALFLVLLRRNALSPFATGVYLTVALLGATLSHESLVFYAPYFFAALVLAGRSLPQAARQCAIPFVLSLIAAYLCGRYTGSLHTAQQICSSLGYPMHLQYAGTEVCDGGAIPYLRYTRAMARAQEVSAVRQYHYFAVYLPIALLAVLPLLAGARRLAMSGRRREVMVLGAAALVSFAGTLLLFAFAIDWGRWIYIHAFAAGLLLLFLDGREAQTGAGDEPVRSLPRWRSWAWAAVLVLYATVWSVPEFYTGGYRWGYVGLADFVLFHKHSIEHSIESGAHAAQ